MNPKHHPDGHYSKTGVLSESSSNIRHFFAYFWPHNPPPPPASQTKHRPPPLSTEDATKEQKRTTRTITPGCFVYCSQSVCCPRSGRRERGRRSFDSRRKRTSYHDEGSSPIALGSTLPGRFDLLLPTVYTSASTQIHPHIHIHLHFLATA